MHCNIAPLPGKSQQLGAADKKREEGDFKKKKRMQVQKVSLSEEKQEQKNSQKQPL